MPQPVGISLATRSNVLRYPKPVATLIAAEGPTPSGVDDMTAAEFGTRNNVLRYPKEAAAFLSEVVYAEGSSSSSSSS